MPATSKRIPQYPQNRPTTNVTVLWKIDRIGLNYHDHEFNQCVITPLVPFGLLKCTTLIYWYKYKVGEMSGLANLTKCLLVNCPLAKCPLAKCHGFPKYTIHENMITHVQSFSVLYETQQKITVCCIWHCSWVAVGTFCREGVLDIIKILLYLL